MKIILNMKQAIIKATRTTHAVGWATLKEWAAYRSHMAVSIIVGPIYFLVQYFIWDAMFANRETLNGFTLEEMLVYYGAMSVITYLTFDFADWNLQMLIRTGKYTTFILRPVSHRFFALSQKIGHRTLGFWLEFLPVLLIYLFIFKINLIPPEPGWAIISVILGFLMTFLLNYCIGLTAFWLTNAGGIRRIFLLIRDLSGGMFVPLTFFPDIVQTILFFLPFQFMLYVPVQVFIGNYELAGISLSLPQIVGIQALAVIAMWGVSEVLVRLGENKFTGVGV
ncbi:ABC transporter permease [Litchfieldia salsa]|uniref:ABC-2 type transport system permease protein n=1 Tax=Litchfieldia salsa TaxID=930152 RepID=A0A1H0Q9B5_9BACI|nr:ABC-2 family transporter protein [Litchfieldia salsa]SDP13961.1 ABC-2 type transport system permease protein [Litchfieldia salsa]